MDSSRKLFGTPLTIDWLQETIRSRLGVQDSNAKIVAWRSDYRDDDKAEGHGFLSLTVRLEMDWQGAKAAEMPNSVFMKIPGMDAITALTHQVQDQQTGGKKRSTANMVPVSDLHNMECRVYELWRDKPPSPKLPLCYFSHKMQVDDKQAVVILQDFSKNATVPRLGEDLSLEQVLQVAEVWAKLHAWSLQNTPSIMNLYQTEKMLCFRPLVISLLHEMKNKFPGYYPLAKVEKVVESVTTENYARQLYYFKNLKTISTVLVQGDCWSNNLLFEKQTDADGTERASDKLLAIIDWQNAHFGSPAEDMGRLIFSNTSPEFRRAEFPSKVAPYYYKALGESLGREPPFSLAQLMEAYKHMYRPGLVLFLSLGTMAVMTKKVEELGDQDALQRLLRRGQALVNDIIKVWADNTLP